MVKNDLWELQLKLGIGFPKRLWHYPELPLGFPAPSKQVFSKKKSVLRGTWALFEFLYPRDYLFRVATIGTAFCLKK